MLRIGIAERTPRSKLSPYSAIGNTFASQSLWDMHVTPSSEILPPQGDEICTHGGPVWHPIANTNARIAALVQMFRGWLGPTYRKGQKQVSPRHKALHPGCPWPLRELFYTSASTFGILNDTKTSGETFHRQRNGIT